MLSMIIAGVAVASAQPSVTYLECDTIQEGQPQHYRVTLNEAAGTVDWANSIVRRRDAAQFSADAVRYLDTTISRIDLRIQRRYDDLLGNPKVENGTCRVVPQVKRAF